MDSSKIDPNLLHLRLTLVGTSVADQTSPLDGVLDEIRTYFQPTPGREADVAFSKRSPNGLFIAVDAAEYTLSKYSPETPDTDLISGLYSFEELKAKEMRAPEAVIEGLIYSGETSLIAGRPKVGKSRLVHQMAHCIVNGMPFLGMPVTRRRGVLIIDLENRPWAIKDRLTRMAGADGMATGLYIWCTDSLSSDEMNATPKGIERLRKALEQSRAEVLIIDPWRLFLGKDENNAEEIVKGLRSIAGLRDQFPNLTIVIIHHVRKERVESPRNLLADPRLWADTVSGHHALSSHVDSCYGLERQKDEDTGEEWITFGGIARNTAPQTLLLEEDDDTLRFEVCRQEEALESVLTSAEKPIWKAASGMKAFGFNDLVKKADTTNRKAVARMLKKAEAHGLVRQLINKTYETVNPTG
jgi:hypothetical protein